MRPTEPRPDLDDMTVPLEAVMARERATPRPLPLKAADRRWLFARWCELNPGPLREIELTAVAIDARGRRVSAKYLVEKLRYEYAGAIVGVPFVDGSGAEHRYSVNNSDTACLARWLLARHPGMRIETRRSMLDGGEGGGDGGR